MRIRSGAALAASLLSVAPPPAAHADPPTVTTTYTVSISRRGLGGGGYLVVVGCRALAEPGSNWQVPLVTEVTCSVNDTVRTALAPGAVATTQIVLVAPLAPVYACRSGEAALMDQELNNNQLYHVAAPTICMRMANT